MLNKYEQQKQLKKAVHDDMEKRVNPEARTSFSRGAYPVQHINVKSMLEIKKDINFILARTGMLDSWERETIRRIVKRLQEGSDTNGQDYFGE